MIYKKIGKNRSGFTLMEVLVASSIFAVVMVFVTGTVVASSNYQSKIRIMNQTSEESRRLADMITRDIRSANYKLTINTSDISDPGLPPSPTVLPGATTTVYNFKNGLAIIKSKDISYNYENSLTFEPIDADTLIISLKDMYKIYRTDGTKLYYGEIIRAGNDPLPISKISSAGDQLSKENLSVDVKFGGFAPDDLHATGQPMIKFLISVGSNKPGIYDSYNTVIRSAVTSRSYNE